MNKLIKLVGGIILFIGLTGLFVSKSPSYNNKSESITYGIVFTIVGGIILAVTNSKEEK